MSGKKGPHIGNQDDVIRWPLQCHDYDLLPDRFAAMPESMRPPDGRKKTHAPLVGSCCCDTATRLGLYGGRDESCVVHISSGRMSQQQKTLPSPPVPSQNRTQVDILPAVVSSSVSVNYFSWTSSISGPFMGLRVSSITSYRLHL
ncbi:hypothetical protein EYF80_029878 [Liparis tanakae]|uniref:Uncharacterized protein n=1 Tax=Liparis tanakae TaxID=230148 RepID=A0A4Z2H4S4_9TELE|nr:hypothetical protein EYF80_029878 [Liparis tanakae]